MMDLFPDVIRMESASACNYKCIHCPTGTNSSTGSGTGLLTKEQFDDILKQFRDNNFVPRVVVLYHGGEPLLNKNLECFIETLKGLGVSKTVITTNGSLLTKERAKALILAGLDEMKVSFDGESQEENNQIRKNADFQRDGSNIKEFIRIKIDLDLKTPVVKLSNVRIYDKNGLDQLYESGNFISNSLPLYLKEFFKNELDDVKCQSIPSMVWPAFEKTENFTIQSYEGEEPRYCPNLFETTTILSNGDVVACCYDLSGEEVFGNVFKQNIFEIWECEKYSSFRNAFRNRKYSAMCLKCKYVNPRFLCKKQ